MSADPPTALTDQAYLIAYDVAKGKLSGTNRGQLVQAAALVELTWAGHLADAEGKPRATGTHSGDPVLDAVLDRIAGSKPRPWKHWVEKSHKETYTAVRDRLAQRRVLQVTGRKVLGLFPVTDVVVRDTRTVRELVAGARRAVLAGVPAERVDRRDVALATLSSAVELNTVFSGKERRAQRDRIKDLTGRTGPAATALRKVVKDQQAAASAAAFS